MRVSVLWLIFFYSSALLGQEEVDVHSSTELYFEDAAGRRDTLTLGWYNSLDDGVINYDVALGEENLIGVPFDSTFEVRISDGVAYGQEIRKMSHNFYGKRGLHTPFSQFCQYGYQAPILLIHTVDPPVRISWDSMFFAQEICTYNSILLDHDIWIEFSPEEEPWKRNGVYELQNYCMIDQGMAELSLVPIDYPRIGWTDFTYDFPLNSGDTVTHGAYAILVDFYIPFLCDRLFTSTEDDLLAQEAFNVFPNPASDCIYISNMDVGAGVEVFDLAGSRVVTAQKAEIDISGLRSGTYVVKTVVNGARRVAKFMKM